MSAHASDQGPDLHEIFGMETGEHPVVVALPEHEAAGVEPEVITESAGGGGGESAAPPDREGGTPPNKEPEGRMGITSPSRRGSSSRFLTDVIVDMGLVARERVDDAIATSRSSGTTPERVLVEEGILSHDGLARALAERYGLDHLDLGVFSVDMGGGQPRDDGGGQALPGGAGGVRGQAHAAGGDDRPLERAGGGRHRDHDRLRGARRGRSARGHRRADLAPGPPRRRGGRHRRASPAKRRRREVVELHETDDDAPVVKLVNQIVAQAVEQGASDVHITPDGQGDCACASASTACCTTSPRFRAGWRARRRFAREDHGRARHLRAPPAAGRPRRADRRRPPRRPARRDAADRARRVDRDAHPRQGLRGDGARQSSAWATRSASASSTPYTRPTARCSSPARPAPASRRRCTRRYRRSNTPEKNIITIEDPVEYQLEGITQVQVVAEGRPDLRHRPARDGARRPRRDHGRRDPRPRDRADRDRGGADGAPRALDAAHQRRPVGRSRA